MKCTRYKLTLIATLVACVVVVLGAFTRLADAGLGCPDWPTCYGHLWIPDTQAEIAAANAAFAETPVETDKTWPEQTHRIVASSLGLLILGLVFLSGLKPKSPEVPHKHVYGLLVLVIIQALVGMWTVTLKLWPQVVTAHLLGGFATLGLLWLLLQRLGNYQWQLSAVTFEKLAPLKTWLVICLLVVTVQIALGGWTSSNYAALACTDLPTCQGMWLPETDFRQGFNFSQSIGPNYLGGLMDNQARTAIHLSHRIGAIITSILVLVLVFKLMRTPLSQAKFWGGILFMALLVQVSLGATNILAMLPLPVAVAHNAMGAVLLLILITVSHRIFTAQVRDNI